MFCQLYKWIFARSIDLNKKLPGFMARHMNRCSSCREYSSFSSYLQTHGPEQAVKLAQPMAGRLAENIIEDFNKSTPAQRPPARRLPLVPAFALSLVLLVVMAGFFFFLNQNSNAEKNFFFNWMNTKLPGTTQGVIDLVAGADNPMEQEYQEIKKTLDSARNFFVSALDIKFSVKDNRREQIPSAEVN